MNIIEIFQNLDSLTYLDIVNLVFTIITTVLGLLYAHFVIFFIVGLFTKKKFPEAEEKLKYGIIISARNEADVIGNLIASIRKNKYPQENLKIFVVAHNCTDDTAKIAQEAGATVYPYDNPEERTKGYALKYLFSKIKEDYGVESFDGYIMLDADNILDVNYISKMNDAFVARGKKDIITSFRNSKNFGTNVISALYGLYFMYGCAFESRGRTVVGCSTRVPGTGFLMGADAVKDGWNYVTLTEDWEFSVDQILQNRKMIYCDEAVFYDEQPTGVKMMFRQRLRWQRGHMLVFLTRCRDLIKGMFKPKKKGGCQIKGSLYDISANIMPILVTTFVLFFVQLGLTALAPVIQDISAAEVWKQWGINFGFMVAGYYAANFISSIILIIMERKRIKGVGFFTMTAAILIWPLFLFLSIPLDFISIFCRNLGWKPIPHKDTTTFEHLNAAEATPATEALQEGENDDEKVD